MLIPRASSSLEVQRYGVLLPRTGEGRSPHPPPRFRSHAQHVELAGPPLTTAVAAAQLMRFPGQGRGGFRQERRLTSLKGGTFLNG